MSKQIEFNSCVKGSYYALSEGDGFWGLYKEKGICIGSASKDDRYYTFNPNSNHPRADNQEFISYVLNSLNNCIVIPKAHYVYLTFVNKALRYIGKGFGRRFVHTISGTSHVYDLNRDYFNRAIIEVFCYADDLTDADALNLESKLIYEYNRQNSKNLYNSIGTKIDYTGTGEKPWLDSSIYKGTKYMTLIGVKVGPDEEYEFLEEFDEHYVFGVNSDRLHINT